MTSQNDTIKRFPSIRVNFIRVNLDSRVPRDTSRIMQISAAPGYGCLESFVIPDMGTFLCRELCYRACVMNSSEVLKATNAEENMTKVKNL